MNTTAMVLTISGLGLCFIPGLAGWIGVLLAFTGAVIGVIGLTNIRTSPSGLGMDVAAWVYGGCTTAIGVGFQIKYAAGALDSLLIPVSLQTAEIMGAVLIPIFIAVQLLARKKFRLAGTAVALILLVSIISTGWTALWLADSAGLKIPMP